MTPRHTGYTGHTAPRSRPAGYALAPAARMLWRAPDRVQFEIGSRAVVVDGLSARTARSLTSERERPEGNAAGALHQLSELGMIWPRSELSEQPAPATAQLAGELAALSGRVGPAATDVLQARRRTSVAIQGAGRAAVHVGALLAASGIGHLQFLATSDVKLHQAVPGGLLPADEAQRMATAARAAVKRAAPTTAVGPRTSDFAPDLVILAVDEPIDDDRRDGLHASATAHLVVALSPASATVGPLVLPGLTSCLRCADLHRTDRDDAWPRLAVQLTVAKRYGPASEVAVATIAAGVAAMQALAFLDGAEPACLDGTIELHPPDWRLRRRSWPAHPKCGCCRAA